MVEGGVLTGSKGEAGSAVTTKYASSAHATNYRTTQLLLHVLETHCISWTVLYFTYKVMINI